MKKIYEAPQMGIETFLTENVITLSGDTAENKLRKTGIFSDTKDVAVESWDNMN